MKVIGQAEFMKIFKDFSIQISSQILSECFRQITEHGPKLIDFKKFLIAIQGAFSYESQNPRDTSSIVLKFSLNDKTYIFQRLKTIQNQEQKPKDMEVYNISSSPMQDHMSRVINLSPRSKQVMKHHVKIMKLKRQMSSRPQMGLE